MQKLGEKIAQKRRDLGVTQIEFAEKLSVTRQTVSRWEAGTVLPDIDKIPDIAALLGVSCDYLLNDASVDQTGAAPAGAVSRLLRQAQGQRVRLAFFDDEADPDLYNAVCVVEDFEGSWMKVAAETKKGRVEKLLPLTSVRSLEYVQEAK